MSLLINSIFQSPKPATYGVNSFPNELCWFPPKTPCLWVPYPRSDTIILYLHGNASDLGVDRDFMWRMSQALQVNVLGMEFPGYGALVSWELPSEENLFRRVKEVCQELSKIEGVRSIVVLGYSLGATAAIHLAAHPPCSRVKALVLYAPFSSLHDLIEDVANNSLISGTLKGLIPNQVFHNHQTIQNIDVPIAIFHGDLDMLIPLRHAQQLTQANPLSRLFVMSGMSHNISASGRIEAQLFQRTREFLSGVFLSESENERTETMPLQQQISFPPEFWTAPNLLTPSGEEVGGPAHYLWIGLSLTIFGLLALFLLRQCRLQTK